MDPCSHFCFRFALSATILGASGLVFASDIVEVVPITNKIVMVHFNDGYVIHHKIGRPRTDETVVLSALDLTAATKTSSYSITSTNDTKYRTAKTPTSLGRKTKGTDFAWFIDNWIDNHVVNNRPDLTQEHWIYLTLPTPLVSGKTYKFNTGTLAKNGSSWTLAFNEQSTRSESLHVNLLGYVPTAPAKYGYVYHWAGDKGGIDFQDYVGKRFWLVDTATGTAAFTGKVAFRKSATTIETGQWNDTPNANFEGADVYECDFSRFKTTGKYVLAVQGLGASFPFQIDADIYRPAFVTTTRGLYHNRSGIALVQPYTEFVRAAPHNPVQTSGFRDKLKYTSSRVIDWKNSDNDPADKPKIEAGIKGTINSAGWYQDAGDWDSYPTHLRVASELLTAYELAPRNFGDGDLNIPESGNRLPDILDEAAWLPRFCQRLRAELLTKKFGTGGIGLRICGDHFGGDGEGVPSYKDVNRTWIASGEDPMSTFRYAATAAQLAYCLKVARRSDPKRVDWTKEAKEAYAWAVANTKPGDESKVIAFRAYAASALFRLTEDKAYETRFKTDIANQNAGDLTSEDWQYGTYIYALGGAPTLVRDAATLTKVRNAIFDQANFFTDTGANRSLRWGGNFYFPMLIGLLSTPMIMPIAVASKISTDAIQSAKYRSSLYTTADYFLGTNSLNMTWTTGLGARRPERVFHLDAWYNGKSGPHPGIVPYGPWRKDNDQGQGPWDHDWVNKSGSTTDALPFLQSSRSTKTRC
jgi:endoglucanase